jgi:hypothetical protein
MNFSFTNVIQKYVILGMRKRKVKSSVGVNKHHTLKIYGGVEV